MRAIAAPTMDPKLVYTTCINSIKDGNLRNRLEGVIDDILLEAENFKRKALAKQLYTFAANVDHDSDIILGQVTKSELIKVYTEHMVGKNKPAREFYDILFNLAPQGKCPFCGFSSVGSLDHYLPKSKFPKLSVVPTNLIPSCNDCNKKKGVATATTINEQNLHPYFDHGHFIKDQWLFAEVIDTNPITIDFYISPPDHWDETSKSRVKSHFLNCNLGCRYKTETSAELAILESTLSLYDNLEASSIKRELTIRAEGMFNLHKNSWQGAMYQALANSDSYCNSYSTSYVKSILL